MSDSAAYSVGTLIADALVAFVVIGLIVVVVGLVVRASRRTAPVGMTFSITVSPDGRYWWDGTTWQDVNVSAPAHAPRSPDSAYWWDGKAWRSVPRNQ